MKHNLTTHYGICKYDAENIYCAICDGVYEFCERCRLFTGCLTTECCGYNAYHIMGPYVYFGVADYVNGNWIFPGTDTKVWEIYREAEKYIHVSEYDVQILPPPNIRFHSFTKSRRKTDQV